MRRADAIEHALPDEPTGVRPAETIGIMIDELLQSADVTGRLDLSLVIVSKNRGVRLDSTLFPSGFVVALTQDVSG